MYTLEYDIDLYKTCKKLPKRDKESIIEALENLSKNPRQEGTIKLSGRENAYRFRVGNYRIIYQIKDEKLIVLVLDIDARKDIYKKR